MGFALEPVVLSGKAVELVPLHERVAPGLWKASLDTEIWRWFPFEVHSEAELAQFIRAAVAMNEAGHSLGFSIHRDGVAIGMTGYWNGDAANRRVEIGATWITRGQQRTIANTEAKYLLLRHAFESLGCIRVEFKTDALNERSRRALLRIGAREEGTLRSHMVLPSGRIRDSVYFSIIEPEWPAVKARLESLLG